MDTDISRHKCTLFLRDEQNPSKINDRSRIGRCFDQISIPQTSTSTLMVFSNVRAMIFAKQQTRSHIQSTSFSSQLMNGPNKLQCLFLAILSSPL
jgi:hypothetical protein